MKLRGYLAVVLLLALCAGCAKPAVPAPAADAGDTAAALQTVERLPSGTMAQQSGSSAIGAVPAPVALPSIAPDTLAVLFINVGKADATLILYGGASVLIDTGTKESAPQLLGALRLMGVTALDALVLTHTHSDHIGGMRALCMNLPVRQAYAAAISENKKNGENKIAERASECGVPLTRLSAGDVLTPAKGFDFTVVGPLRYDGNDDNDNSLVLRLALHGRTLLFTGDMQFAEEQTLLAHGVDVSADVLKVGNHGNPDATSDAFAAAAAPHIAVISTDTSVDTDSANPRVRAALSMADIRVTEDYAAGVLLTVGPSGDMQLANPAVPAGGAALSIAHKDVAAQTVTIRNDGASADVGGYMLYSERGGELFCFPAGSRLDAGAVVTVSGAGGAGDYAFSGEQEPWHTKKDDPAILYDPYGRELARD